jgi:NADH:ubiquinone reductase (H+-translocating)
MMSEASPPHLLVVGGGYVGMYTALRLQRRLRRGEATVTVVTEQPNMTYQPLLAEAASGLVEPRQVVVPLRRVLRRCRVLIGEVSAVDHPRRVATAVLPGGEQIRLPYDVLVLAPGSVSRTLPVPGLVEVGIGFKTVGEAIYLRNQVLSRLDEASSTEDPERRRRALTFVFVGGGYAGIEALGELEDMARHAVRFHAGLRRPELRWVLVEAADRILPELSRSLADYTVQRLRERGVEVRLETRVESMVDGHVVLSDGARFDAGTVVWTAGVKAHPLAARSGLPVDLTGRVVCTPDLRISGTEGAWSAGDGAAVPDLSRRDVPGALCGPTAQHAVRQAKRMADNIVAVLRGRRPRPYRHADLGSVASLGLHQGVAELLGVKLRGRPAWYLHRAYHLSRVPTLDHKVRVLAGWTLALFLRREVVSLGQLQHPRREWESAARQAQPASG